MSILRELETSFKTVLATIVDEPDSLLDMLRASQDPKFGDYQANFAMPLGKQLGKPPREVATEIVEKLDVSNICDAPEIAGPGFINLRLKDDWIADRLNSAIQDERLGVEPVAEPRTYVVDFSSPNVAKPMHVGHIRSTVIGNSLAKTLRFVGHNVITDNHIGDWGTQFGMIIYGFKHFLDRKAYEQNPVEELARLYRLVRQLVDYHAGRAALAPLQEKIDKATAALEKAETEATADGNEPDKKARKELKRQRSKLAEMDENLKSLESKLAKIDADPELSQLVAQHETIGRDTLLETAKLHADDEENLALWREFLPFCEDEINRVYGRLKVEFDHTLGESFYHNRLAQVVDTLLEKGIARASDGAICVFFEGKDVPMIVRKQDGAFLYATTDLATVEYRVETWNPDAILYVVDFRQGMHFDNFFDVARMLGHEDIELKHVSFGTVMGEDKKPYKTRSGDTVGLEGLLDEAVSRALKIVTENDERKPSGGELSEQQRQSAAEKVGIAALIYADLSQNRESDYVFSYDKMLAMNGNTATYMQYAYARVRSIFAKCDVDDESIEALRHSGQKIMLATPAERALGLELLRLSDALDTMLKDYRPNFLTAYLFELAGKYSSFYDQCSVLNAETEELRNSRLLLCDLTARTIQKGLELLGIETVERM